ncbi:hypothetical protein JOQ06_006485, partial [Pogonophryne albipinna]
DEPVAMGPVAMTAQHPPPTRSSASTPQTADSSSSSELSFCPEDDCFDCVLNTLQAASVFVTKAMKTYETRRKKGEGRVMETMHE